MVDLLLLALLMGAAVLGWRRGLAVSMLAGLAFAMIGLPAAALAAAFGFMPPVLAFLLGGMVAMIPFALRMNRITEHVEVHLQGPRIQSINRFAGAALNAAIALGLAWFIGAIASIVPGESGALSIMRSSVALSSLIEVVPPQGTLGSVVLRSGLVPGANGPLVLAEEPDPRSAETPGVLTARASVLQVRSTACQAIVTGTGWVAGPGIVVTNAHVVAGSAKSFLSGGPRFEGTPATVTAFDPVNDIAVLTLDDRQAILPRPLTIVSRVQHGERAAVIGFPLGDEQTAIPARIDRVAQFHVEPLGGGSAVPAQVLAFRADVRPGNSGGPIVDERGAALGLVVSKALGQRIEAAYGVSSSELLRAIAAGARRQPASTGRCLAPEDLESDGVLPPVGGQPRDGALPGGGAKPAG